VLVRSKGALSKLDQDILSAKQPPRRMAKSIVLAGRHGRSMMAISGLVVTLSDDAAAEAAFSALRSDPRLTLGERFGRRVAVVAETPSVHDDRSLFDELRGRSGITHVDVIFVHLDTQPAAGENQGANTPVEYQHAHR
jgi:hypothetical protein